MGIKENIEEIKSKIPSEVQLLAVSKTKPIEALEEAYAAGMREFGENKVQELLAKEEIFHKDVKWHLIGHLQTNKVKYLVDKVHLIHSLDSIKLLEEIEKVYEKNEKTANTLIQINIGREESNRYYFKKTKGIFDELKCKKFKNISMDILSMGMTNDYMTAIEEGSTLVRVGTGIFGERNYNV